MTWLFVLAAWTVCALVVAPVIGRALAYGERAAGTPRRRRLHSPLPPPRAPLVLR